MLSRILYLAIVMLVLPVAQPTLSAKSPASGKTFLFLEWRDQDSTVVLGHFGDNKRSRIVDTSLMLRSVQKADIDRWLSSFHRQKALLFFHCMWGQQPGFHRQCLGSLDRILGEDTSGAVISILWHAGGIRYKDDWNDAVTKGEALGQITGWINLYFDKRTDVLCHSMGNRFFEGVLRTMPDDQRRFDHIVLFSADLDNTLDSDMQLCLASSPSVNAYIHKRDRMLLMSKLMHKRQRLGRDGFAAAAAGLKTVDMTTHVHGISNHVHLRRKWVRERIRMNLAE